jgi:hypothetical protein
MFHSRTSPQDEHSESPHIHRNGSLFIVDAPETLFPIQIVLHKVSFGSQEYNLVTEGAVKSAVKSASGSAKPSGV